MINDVSIIIKPEEEGNQNIINSKIIRALLDKGISVRSGEFSSVFVKKSIDARHGKIKICLRYRIYIGEKPEDEEAQVPEWKKADGKHSVIIVGLGPAGLFGALRLLEKGIKPIIIERGLRTGDRKKDIAAISTKGMLDENSNYCFGEGGAGTFSDGKLYTRSNKRGNIGKILKIFVEFGADDAILTDAHPHIGTDRLPMIINAMRDKIIELGGEIHFCTRCTGFEIDPESKKSGKVKITGVHVENTKDGSTSTLKAQAVILATGHSASDMYEIIAKIAPQALEAKTFAAGVRVEHPRELIDAIQFHGEKMKQAAEYRLTAQVDNRGVYSFCMCPGGFVVPSATSPDEIVVNGMSSSARNSQWSNAAIVVETRPEDISPEFKKQAEDAGCPALAGLFWRTWLERETARHGKAQSAPAQRLTDFLEGKESTDLPKSSYTPGLISSRLDQWLPEQIRYRLQAAFREYDKNMKGFVCPDALLIASETRTSTPVRINRDKESCECCEIAGLYPAGEGSGYSGGIVSSAMDGERVCAALSQRLLSE